MSTPCVSDNTSTQRVTVDLDPNDEFLRLGCAVCNCYFAADSSPLKVCALCHSVKYCSREHQKKHWKEHKKSCGKTKKDILNEHKAQGTGSSFEYTRFFNRGMRKLASNDIDDAITSFEKARHIADNYEFTDEHGRTAIAVAFNQRINIGEQLVLTYIHYGNRQRDAKKEIKRMKKIAVGKPESKYYFAKIQFLEASISRGDGDFPRCEKLLESSSKTMQKYIETDCVGLEMIAKKDVINDLVDILRNLVEAYGQQQKLPEQLATSQLFVKYARLQDIKGSLEMALLSLGHAFGEVGDSKKAIAAFEEATSGFERMKLHRKAFFGHMAAARYYEQLLKSLCKCQQKQQVRCRKLKDHIYVASEIVSEHKDVIESPMRIHDIIPEDNFVNFLGCWIRTVNTLMVRCPNELCVGPLYSEKDLLCKRYLRNKSLKRKVDKMGHGGLLRVEGYGFDAYCRNLDDVEALKLSSV